MSFCKENRQMLKVHIASCTCDFVLNVLRYNHGMVHPMQFIATIPMLTTEIENGAWHCSAESRGSCFYRNPSLPPSNQCCMLVDLARLLTTWIGSTLRWGKGDFFFSLIRQSVPTIFSRIVASFVNMRHNCDCNQYSYFFRNWVWVCYGFTEQKQNKTKQNKKKN